MWAAPLAAQTGPTPEAAEQSPALDRRGDVTLIVNGAFGPPGLGARLGGADGAAVELAVARETFLEADPSTRTDGGSSRRDSRSPAGWRPACGGPLRAGVVGSYGRLGVRRSRGGTVEADDGYVQPGPDETRRRLVFDGGSTQFYSRRAHLRPLASVAPPRARGGRGGPPTGVGSLLPSARVPNAHPF